jgi:hypothetical protein
VEKYLHRIVENPKNNLWKAYLKAKDLQKIKTYKR